VRIFSYLNWKGRLWCPRCIPFNVFNCEKEVLGLRLLGICCRLIWVYGNRFSFGVFKNRLKELEVGSSGRRCFLWLRYEHLCELGYDDLSLGLGFIHSKIIFLFFILSVTVLCWIVLKLCVMCYCCCLGQDTLVKDIFYLNEAFPG